jgi:hypothetical protein
MAEQTGGEIVPVTLSGPLAGKQIMVDLDRLTIGTLEDMESQRVTVVKAAICSLIVGGDLGDDVSAATRKLKPGEFGALVDGVLGAIRPKKAR